jgi:hypothetical protein
MAGLIDGCRLCGSPLAQIGTFRNGCKAQPARPLNARYSALNAALASSIDGVCP